MWKKYKWRLNKSKRNTKTIGTVSIDENKKFITIDQVDSVKNYNKEEITKENLKLNNTEDNGSILSFNLTKSNLKNSLLTTYNDEDKSLKLIELSNKEEYEFFYNY